MRTINAAGLTHLKTWEGFRDTAYQDTGGVWTIGFGTTRYPDGRPVQAGDRITPEDAERLIWEADGGLRMVADAIERAVNASVLTRLTDNQYAALASWIYNVGIGSFRQSTLLKRLNAGRLADIPDQMRRWKYDNGQIVKGLMDRRDAEASLWNTPDPAPSAS